MCSIFCRNGSGYGGSGILVHKSLIDILNVEKVYKNISEEGLFECSAIQATYKNTPIIFISLYRPPKSSIKKFLSKLEDLLFRIYRQNINKRIILCGDLNIDFSSDTIEKQLLVNTLNSYSLENKLNDFTHYTPNTATAIDYVISHTNMLLTVANTEPGLSDHYAQIIQLKLKDVINLENTITCKGRNYSPENYIYFNNRLTAEKWLEINDSNDVNTNYMMFLKTFLLLFEESFPITIKQYNLKHNRLASKPEWISQGIINSSKKLKLLYRLNKQITDPRFTIYYINYRKIYRKVVKVAKKKHISNKITKCINKPKEVWQIINNILGNKTIKKKEKISIKINDNTITVAKEIANIINTHYVNISSKLNISNDPPITYEQTDSSTTKCKEQFVLHQTDEKEIHKAISSLKNKRSQDIHGLSNMLLKVCGKNILQPLKTIINQSLKTGIFPDKMKVAKILPIFKKGDKHKIENYRPISLLPAFSKVFEKILHNRLSTFLEKNKLICTQQSGFQKNKSTMTAVFQVTKAISEALDKGNHVYGIFCDLSKAFDLVDHRILLHKLSNLGINGWALNLLKSYLYNRTQIVEIYDGKNKVTSDWETIKTGVPQGSILGPLLFLIYINDLPDKLRCGNPTLFADDTSIIVNNNNIDALSKIAENTLTSLEKWFKKNRLVLNVDKSQFIQFSKQNRQREQILLSHNSTIIKETEVVKFLGLHIDKRLTWSEQITKLENKLSSICYLLRSLKLIIDSETLRMTYYTYFHSVMTYGVEFWGNTTNSIKIFRVQKRAIRILAGASYKTSCRPLFKVLKIRTLYQEYAIHVLKFVNRHLDYYVKKDFTHSHTTRNAHKLRVMQHTSSLFGKSFYYTGLKMYNQLPKHIFLEKNPNKFNRLITNIFENQYIYNVQEIEECFLRKMY